MRLMALATTATLWLAVIIIACTSGQARMRQYRGATKVASLSTLKTRVNMEMALIKPPEQTCITALLAASRGAPVKGHHRDEGTEREDKGDIK